MSDAINHPRLKASTVLLGSRIFLLHHFPNPRKPSPNSLVPFLPGLDRGHFLSPTGQCKAFDAFASRSEGCGIFVLKRLSDTIAENDNIWRLIRGIEVNQSGLAHSITRPHAPTQITLFKQLLENTGVDANRINVVETFTSIFETLISQLASSIMGHRVAGIALCPASVYLEQLFAGIDLTRIHLGSESNDKQAILRAIKFMHGLVYDESITRIVVTVITLTGDAGTFSVSSRAEGSNEQISHAHDEFRLQSAAATLTKFTRALPTINRYIAAVTKSSSQQKTFSTRTVYDGLFQRVVDYSREYHTMQSLMIDASHMEGCARVRLPRDHDKGPCVVHPVFMDNFM